MFRSALLSFFFLPAMAVPAPIWAAPIETEAKQAIIVDHETGIVLFEKEARAPMPPASMTKIMTVQMVFEAIQRGDLSEDTMVTVSADAWRRGGVASGSSTMFLEPGSEVSVIDLLRGVIVQSGNDAAITLAEALSGSEEAFSRDMTRRARDMGLSTATFRNATGWPDDEHEISAADLAELTRIQIETFPDYYAIYAEPNFTWNNHRQSNRNPLLGSFEGADGVKTGATSVAGYGLVASAVRDGERRTVVFNGLEGRQERERVARELMTAAFNAFDVMDMYQSGQNMGAVPVYMGKTETVNAVLRDDIKLGYHRDERDTIKARIDYKIVPAPVEAGAIVGEVVITKADEEVGRYPLYAVNSVKRKGFFSRIGASVLQKIRG